MKPIGTFCTAALIEYFDTNLEKPRRHGQLVAVAEKAPAKIKVPYLSAAIDAEWLTSLFRSQTEEHRIYSAAWLWIRPNLPLKTIDDIQSIATRCGLSHLEKYSLIKRLIESCNDIIRAHPPLRLLIQVRIALLEFCITRDKPSSSAPYAAAPQVKHSLIQSVVYLGYGETALSVDTAKSVGTMSLQAAAQIVSNIFCDEICAVSANLMVPVAAKSLHASMIKKAATTKNNYKVAADMWKNVSGYEKCLLIVSETKNSSHRGFWVPVTSKDGSTYLPGAPHALMRMQGSAVFKDDLPTLNGFDSQVSDNWSHYMRHDFEDHLFISLPLRVSNLCERSGSIVAAVLNVNAGPTNISKWRRAYHQEWLERAIIKAGEFVETALLAQQVEKTASPTGTYPDADTGCDMWDKLPGTSFGNQE